MYRLVITVVMPGPAAQASSAFQAFAPGAGAPFAYAACLWGDAGGERAEAEGRAAIERHADGEVEVEVVREVRSAGAAGDAALAALSALTDELDALQARAAARYAGEVSCRRGCDSCCHQRVGVSRVEAARVAAAVAAMSEAARAALADSVRRAAALERERCGALDDAGACRIYAARPAICRSHGLTYAMPHLVPGRRLHVLQSSCALNYRGGAADLDHAYDYETWSERLGAIDDAFADEAGVGADLTVGRSIPLADVLGTLFTSAAGSRATPPTAPAGSPRGRPA